MDKSWLRRMMMTLIRVSIHAEVEIMFQGGSQDKVLEKRACQYV